MAMKKLSSTIFLAVFLANVVNSDFFLNTYEKGEVSVIEFLISSKHSIESFLSTFYNAKSSNP